MTVDDALKEAGSRINGLCDNPFRVARILLMHHLDVSNEWIFLNKNIKLERESEFFDLVSRFASYEPLEYITNKVSFYSLDFEIYKGVLIPRSETEILIDRSIEILSNLDSPKVCEIGVGSGVISIVLALKTDARITATDINEKALDLAYKNAKKFKVADRIEFVKTSYMQGINCEFDMIVSNPPYIARYYQLDKFVQNEPHDALFGGEVGDEILKNIIALASDKNIKNLACEIGYNQRDSMQNELVKYGYEPLFYKDLAGFDRGFVAKIKEKK